MSWKKRNVQCLLIVRLWQATIFLFYFFFQSDKNRKIKCWLIKWEFPLSWIHKGGSRSLEKLCNIVYCESSLSHQTSDRNYGNFVGLASHNIKQFRFNATLLHSFYIRAFVTHCIMIWEKLNWWPTCLQTTRNSYWSMIIAQMIASYIPLKVHSSWLSECCSRRNPKI